MKRSFDHSINMHVADVLIMLSGDRIATPSASSGRRVFECKTCCRQFPSFQALGGHRASHKKPRLQPGDAGTAAAGPAKAAKVHGCPVCGLEFAIGQALGGHMRRHRAGTEIEEKDSSANGRRVLLDLNLPPLEVELGLGLGLLCA